MPQWRFHTFLSVYKLILALMHSIAHDCIITMYCNVPLAFLRLLASIPNDISRGASQWLVLSSRAATSKHADVKPVQGTPKITRRLTFRGSAV